MKKQQFYNQYISLGTQMIVCLLLAFFAGKWLDKKVAFKFPLFTIVFCVIVITGLLIKVIKDTSSSK